MAVPISTEPVGYCYRCGEAAYAGVEHVCAEAEMPPAEVIAALTQEGVAEFVEGRRKIAKLIEGMGRAFMERTGYEPEQVMLVVVEGIDRLTYYFTKNPTASELSVVAQDAYRLQMVKLIDFLLLNYPEASKEALLTIDFGPADLAIKLMRQHGG